MPKRSRRVMTRRGKQHPTDRSIDLLNGLFEAAGDANNPAEDNERDIDLGSVDVQSRSQPEAQVRPTARTRTSDYLRVVTNSEDKTPTNSGKVRGPYNHHEDSSDDNDEDDEDEDEEGNDDESKKDKEIPESEQEYDPSEDSESLSSCESSAEGNIKWNSEEPVANQNRRRPTEREEHEIAENAHTPSSGTRLRNRVGDIVEGESSRTNQLSSRRRRTEDNEYVPENTSRTRPRARLIDEMEGQFSQTNQSSSRRRRRETVESEDQHRRTRQRRDPQRYSGNLTYRGAGRLLEDAEWETSIVVDAASTANEIVIIEDSIYDEAKNIEGLERSWDDLIAGCRHIRAMDTNETQSFKGIQDICARIQALNDIYKKIQRDRAAELDTQDSWRRARQGLEPISNSANIIAQKVEKHAKKGEKENNFQIKVQASEYAEQIYKYVVTGLCELALECLKAYYSDDDLWLMSGGFAAVLDILDIIGTLHRTLKTLLKSRLISMIGDISRRVRIPLRSIDEKLRACYNDERLASVSKLH